MVIVITNIKNIKIHIVYNIFLPDFVGGAWGSSVIISRPSGAVFILSSTLDDFWIFVFCSVLGFDT